jgi:Na+-driven multidrug efflux pump
MGASTIVIISSVYLSRRCNLPKQYRFWSLKEPDWVQLKLIFSVGIPSSVLAFLSWSSIFGLTFVLTKLSPQWVAANQIAFVLSTLALVIVNSSSNIVTNSLVEVRLKDQSKQYSAIVSLCLGFTTVSFIISVFIALFLEHLAAIFGSDQDVLKLLIPLSFPFVLFVTLSSLNSTLRAALLANKKTQIALNSQIIAILLLFVLVALSISLHMLSLTVVWWCLCLERAMQIAYNVVWLRLNSTRNTVYGTV